MREVVSVHVGQAGVGMGNAWWELLCLEHGIKPNGTYGDANMDRCESFFLDTGARHFPRAILIDLEPTVCDDVRKGALKNLFHHSNIISGMEDSADNFARGYYSLGSEVIDVCEDNIRKQVERCSSFQGFIMFHATGGGTGSGLGSLLLERLAVDYASSIKFTFTINSSRQVGNSVTEPYNSVLCTHSLLEHTDASFNMDNESLYHVVTSSLKISFPSYHHLNRVIAQVASSVTASLRWSEGGGGGGGLNVSMSDMLTNLVPYPRIHSLITSYAPLIGSDNYAFEPLNPSVTDLTRILFQSNLLSCDSSRGLYLACCLLYRGDVTPRDVCQAVTNLKHSNLCRFVDWVPTGFKCGVTTQPPCHSILETSFGDVFASPRACCMVANSTSIVQTMGNIHHKFDLLYAKHAFVHWYCAEGMEEGEFSDAREDLAALERDYETLSCISADQEEFDLFDSVSSDGDLMGDRNTISSCSPIELHGEVNRTHSISLNDSMPPHCESENRLSDSIDVGIKQHLSRCPVEMDTRDWYSETKDTQN